MEMSKILWTFLLLEVGSDKESRVEGRIRKIPRAAYLQRLHGHHVTF